MTVFYGTENLCSQPQNIVSCPMHTETQNISATSLQSLPVFQAGEFTVVDGANLGDPLMEADELVFDDVYALHPQARMARLTISGNGGDEGFCVAQGTECGTIGARLHLDSVATFMLSDGMTVEVMILVEVSAKDGVIEDIFLLPLTALAPSTNYRLIGVDREAAPSRFAEVACVSFTRGTRITMADGRQLAIQDLRPGDRVLTRDDGPQEVRWIGSNTVRATGEFAPILIAAGTLNNAGDLLVSPNHRLFVYQRRDTLNLGRSEVLVKAKHLVNGKTVTRASGGFVEYFQLLFDDHQIIYAEGIAAESLLLDRRTRPAVPKEVAEKLIEGLRRHEADRHAGMELPDTGISAEMAEKLRISSAR